MTKPFDTFVKKLDAVAQEWPSFHIATAAPEAAHVRYKAVADAAVDEVAASGGVPERLTNGSARHGCKVLTRYCQIAAELAARESYDLEKLRALLEDDRTFESLVPIATIQNRLASRAESDIGLNLHSYPTDEQTLGHYTIDDGYVAVPDLDHIIVRNRLDMLDEGKDLYDGQCAAHANHALKPIFHAFITICARDENLFARSLDS